MNWFFVPISHLTLMSFCTQGLPGVAESTVSKSEGKPSPWGEGARQGGWGVGESALPWPSPTVCDGPPSPGGRGLFFGWWILRLRPAAARRMTALVEMSENQMKIKGGFSPFLTEQNPLIRRFLTKWRSQTGVRMMCYQTFPTTLFKGLQVESVHL